MSDQATSDSVAPDQEAEVLSPIGQAMAEAAAATGDTPEVRPVPRYDAVGIASQGRLTFSLTAFLTYMHSAQLGIPTTPSWGVYWERSVQNAMESAHEKRMAKYLLFYDGDGTWKREDIEELYRVIEHETIDGRPIDAVFPLQADRVHNIPLAYDWHHRVGLQDGPLNLVGPDGHYDYSGPLTRVLHGHHGLTFIRLSALDDMPKPWLRSQPGEGGSYRKGTPNVIDPDTYFWLLMGEHDKVVVQANKVVIGHIDLHVRWQMGRRVFAQPVNAYIEEGSPAGMRCPLPAEYDGTDPQGRLPGDFLVPPDSNWRFHPVEPGSPAKEAMAAQAHIAWAGWTEYMLRLGRPNADGSVTLPADHVSRWRRQVGTAYEDLPASEQESDRVDAAAMLKAMMLTAASDEKMGNAPMPGEPGHYRTLPIVVDAFQFTHQHRQSNEDWPQWLHDAWAKDIFNKATFSLDQGGHSEYLIQTLEGGMRVDPDDWIVRGVHGELHPCKPDIFKATYEKVGG